MRTINSKVSLALLAIFSMAIFACQSEKQETKSAKEVATGFLEKMTAGDIAAAKEYASSGSAQALDMMSTMGETWEGMSYEIVEVNKLDSTATVQYKLDGEDHRLNMTKEDGQWKVEYAFLMPGEGDMMNEEMDDGDMEGEQMKEESSMETGKLDPEQQQPNETKVMKKEEGEVKKRETMDDNGKK